jgi:hypothetical protein
VDAIIRHGRIDNPALAEQTWAYYRNHFRDDLSITPEIVQNTLKSLAEDNPAALAARPEQFIDTTFVDRIKASGYVEQVHGSAR